MSAYTRLALLSTLLALVVITLGAYVRLSHAGLGCPDWPGCYGLIGVPETEQAISRANESFPERPVEVGKAWKEMVHRYFAGTLGILILALAVWAWRRRRGDPSQPVLLPMALLALVIFQALLGMWTVTLLLKPLIVTVHLLGGMLTLALLWWLTLRSGSLLARPADVGAMQARTALAPWALLGVLVLLLQISLGGWTSANYAALACPDFPRCGGAWWPEMQLDEAFVLWRGLGVDYEFGVLEHQARVGIHVMHRVGAAFTFLYLGWLGLKAMLQGEGPVVRGIGAALLGVLLLQVGLGIANVVMQLPLPVAVAHNGVAALLLMTLLALNHVLRPPVKSV